MPVTYPHGKSCVHLYEKFNILRSCSSDGNGGDVMRDTAAVFSLAMLLFIVIGEMEAAKTTDPGPIDALSATE